MQPPVPPNGNPNQQPSPDSRHEKINTLWKIISLAYVLTALGLSFYWEMKETGLCGMIMEWQLSFMDDEYYPALDILGALLLLLIPLFIGKFVVEKVTGVKIDNVKYPGQ
jgi:hypothetical protein